MLFLHVCFLGAKKTVCIKKKKKRNMTIIVVCEQGIYTYLCTRAGWPRQAEPEPSGSAQSEDSTWDTPPTGSQTPPCTPWKGQKTKMWLLQVLFWAAAAETRGYSWKVNFHLLSIGLITLQLITGKSTLGNLMPFQILKAPQMINNLLLFY